MQSNTNYYVLQNCNQFNYIYITFFNIKYITTLVLTLTLTSYFCAMKLERFNLGKLIKEKVEEKGISQAQFAREIGLQRQNVVKTVFEKNSIDTNLLCVISEVLECNFFDYFKSNNSDDKTELKATITIELGKEKKDRTVRFVFGENDIKL